MARQILGMFVALAVLVGAIAAWILFGGVPTKQNLPIAAMQPEQGLAYTTIVPHAAWLDLRTDSMSDLKASNLKLLENGRPLGPAHSMHDAIRRAGAGKYSHWTSWILFASSDGSDPRSNGRTYSVSYTGRVVRGTQPDLILKAVLAGSILAAIAAGVAFLRLSPAKEAEQGATLLARKETRRIARLESERQAQAGKALRAAASKATVVKPQSLSLRDAVRPALGGLLTIAALIAAATGWVRTSGLSFTRDVPAASISQETGLAFTAPVPHEPYLQLKTDSMDASTASDLRLLEDGHPLGPAHSAHDDIRKHGAGLFSDWNNNLIFASSDGSDPRSNGRRYSVVYNARPLPGTTPAMIFEIALLASGAIAAVLAATLLLTVPNGAAAATVSQVSSPARSEGRSAAVPRFAMKTLGLTAIYVVVIVAVYASVVAQSSTTGTFKINYEYRVF